MNGITPRCKADRGKTGFFASLLMFLAALTVLAPVTSSSGTLRSVSAAVTGPAPPPVSSTFDGLALDAYPCYCLSPPSPDLAVGPTQMVEIVNESLAVYSKPVTGAPQPIQSIPDYQIFGLAPAYSVRNFYDVRDFYDPSSQRYFASATNGSVLDVAVSATSDATGAWYEWQSPSGSYDAPSLEVTSDKVMIVSYCSLFVLEKQDVLATTTSPMTPQFTQVSPVCDTYGTDNRAATESSPTPTGYLVHRLQKFSRGLGPDGLSIQAVNGTPRQEDVTLTQAIVNLTIPVLDAPQPPQPPGSGGTTPNLAPEIGEVDSAVWANGNLWMGLGDSCTPPGDTVVRSCLRLVEVSTNGTPALVQDVDAGFSGAYLSYPALAVDPTGDVAIVATLTSTSVFPSVVAAQWDPSGQVSPWSTIRAGTYDERVAQVPEQDYVRWGDWVAASIDPQDREKFWLGSMVAAPDGDWITSFGAVELTPPPAFTADSPPTSATMGDAYSYTFAASGSPAPSFAVSTGGLPPGLELNQTTGVLSGIPTASGSFTFTVTASNGVTPYPVTPALTINVAGPYSPLNPVRICDTRANNPSNLSGTATQCNGLNNAGNTISAGGTQTFNVAGDFGVPADASAVVLNVTVVDPSNAGYLAVFSAGATQPVTSNLDYATGDVVPNLVQVGTGLGGKVSIYSSAGANVVVDLEGYVAPLPLGGAGSGLYNALSSPVRLCDTRAGDPSQLSAPNNQCNGPGNVGERISAGGSINVAVANANGIPAGAAAVVLNVTEVNPGAPGFLTVYPKGGNQPTASNVNYVTNQTSANRVIVPLSADGGITVYSSEPADVVVDVSGYYSAAGGSGAQFSAETVPVRICDTRTTSPVNPCTGHPISPTQSLGLQVGDVAGIPAGATAVVVNLTAVDPTQETFLTVYSSAPLPTTSDLDPAPGTVRANIVVATLSPSGTISIYNDAGGTDVVVDVLGWYT